MLIRPGAAAIEAARCHGERVALEHEGREQSFSELDAVANRVATGLLAQGLATGDRVAVLTHNRIEAVWIWLACERAGLTRVVLHSHFEIEAHVEMLTRTSSRALIFDGRFTESVDATRGRMTAVERFICLDGAPPWALSLDELAARGSDRLETMQLEDTAPFCIQPTTGTTGAAKPWLVTHAGWRTLVAHNLIHLDSVGQTPVQADDVNAHVHALQWASGAQTLMPYLLRGARSVIVDDSAFDPSAILTALRSCGATGVLLPGPMLDALLAVLEREPGPELGLRRLVTLFATPELLDRATRLLGPVWCHGYGSTEQGAPVARLTASELAVSAPRAGSVGRAASPLVEIAIVDGSGTRLPDGSVGEIVVRGTMSSSRYWEDEELTSGAFFPGGWFRSRDLGRLDAEGYLYYVDRAADEISLAARVVYPHAIEEAVLAHPDVASAGAVGAADSERDAVLIAVTLRCTASEELIAELERLAAARLPGNTPIRLHVLEHLPTVLGGAKVRRDELRRQLIREGA
jgi:acyl-coenzyme A synthetase/AMP-(fatty) acid ligase